MLRIGLLSTALVSSGLCLEFLSIPYAGLFIVWSAFFLIVAIQGSRSRLDVLWLNVAVVFLTLGFFEIYLWVGLQKYGRVVYADGYHVEDEVLGFAPRKNQASSTKKYFRDQLLYDVTYTIDENGLRVAPPDGDSDGLGCILFFGGSFAFGEGVNDDETMPYITGLRIGGSHRVYNFAFHGYGPHQMLAALERGRVESIVDSDPEYAFYVAIFDHVSRAVGLRSWGRDGPRFVFDGPFLVHRGRFEDGVLPAALADGIDRSLIVQNIRERPNAVDADDVAVYVAIVDASRKRFETRYPGSEFHVLQVGDVHSAMAMATWEGLEAAGVRVHRREVILPEAAGDPMKYVISEHDSHPNRLAHSRIADYVVDLIR